MSGCFHENYSQRQTWEHFSKSFVVFQKQGGPAAAGKLALYSGDKDSIQSNRKLDKSLHEEKNKTILQPQICLSLFIYSREVVIIYPQLV